jgi:hypothetical protein
VADALEAGVARALGGVVEDLDALVAAGVAGAHRAPRAARPGGQLGGGRAVGGVAERARRGAHVAAPPGGERRARAEAAGGALDGDRAVGAAHVVVVGRGGAPARERRGAERVGHRRRDDVDHAAQRVGAVEHARRPLDHLDALGGRGLDVRRVVVPPRLRLAALAVVEGDHAVVRHPADHGLADAGGHGERAHARHLLERLAERGPLRGAQRGALEHRHRLRRVLRARGRGAGRHLHRRQLDEGGAEGHVEGADAGGEREAPGLRRPPDARDAHRVRPRRHGGETVPTIVARDDGAAQLDELDARARHGRAGRIGHAAVEGGGAALGRGGRGDHGEQDGDARNGRAEHGGVDRDGAGRQARGTRV